MEISYGKGGWVRMTHDEWPGPLLLRLEPDARGRWVTKEFYLQGEWRQVVGRDLRELDLAALEEIAQADSALLEKLSREPGPDMAVLASSYATSVGAQSYDGRHCDTCSAPLRGGRAARAPHWLDNWVALSWLAQKSGKIHRPPVRKPERATYVLDERVPRLQRPTEGLTDEFLVHVREAYNQALAQGKAPAPELSRQIDGHDGSRRTIHKWVQVARDRGIMPPASRKGTAG